MKLNEAKNRIQKAALTAWSSSGEMGTAVLATGVGKSRLGLMAIEKLFDGIDLSVPSEGIPKALIIVPTVNLKDQWKDEFVNWGLQDMLPYVTIECIQTVYKWEKCTYDLLICDEIHTTLSPKYREVYGLIDSKWILGLTATLPEDPEYLTVLDQIAPPCFCFSADEAVDQGLISPYKIYNLPVTLPVKESNKYKFWDKKFKAASIALLSYKRKNKIDGAVFDMAKEFSKDKNHEMYSAAKSYWTAMSMRKHVCYKNSRKLDTVLEILEAFPDKKVIIFSKSTDTVDALCDMINDRNNRDSLALPYHSKMKKDERESTLDMFRDKDYFKVLVSAEALIAGYNLPDIDMGICVAGSGTELKAIQSIGRISRLREGKSHAIFINLYSDNTQEQVWVEKKHKTQKVDYIKKINQII